MAMPDEEIIKALECCCGTAHDSCRDCPYDDIGCEDKLEKDALDLINRQKAEIDIILRKKEKLRDLVAEQQAEIERLRRAVMQARSKPMHKVYNADFVKYKYLLFKGHRESAIKEFAERLKKEVDFIDTTRKLKKTIDNLVKEMVGD